jgi:hypothetical protein
MTGFRQLHTKIWSDKWFGGLPPDFKLLYIYLFGNDKSSMSGIYELPLRIIEFETGLKHDLILDILADFANAGKIEYDYNAEVIWIKNMRKYQGNNKSWQVQERIKKDIDGVPDCDLKKKYIEEEVVVIPDTASMPHGGSSDALITSTSIDTSIDIVKSIDSEGEGMGEGNFTPAETANARAKFENNLQPRRCEKIYQQVTGQFSIPSAVMAQALQDLQAILDHYGKDWDCAVKDGKQIFATWCGTKGKTGKYYSKVNVGWLGKWLEHIAPKPDNPNQNSIDVILEKYREEQPQ